MERLKLLVSIMGGLTSTVSPVVLAQGGDVDGFILEEVVVTAQRRHETLQDAAIPVNAATGDQLLQAGVADAVGLVKLSPALYVANGGGANTGYFVRGVGNFSNNGYTNPAVAFNIDGVYIGRPSSTVASFLDLNRVEVLKGPQGTLYGRNATGGAVNVIPNAPEIGVNGGSVSIEAGNYGKGQVTGVGNFTTGESSAIRLAGTYNVLDGYFDDDTGEVEDTALRAQIYVEPSNIFNYRISADYSKQEGNGAGIDVQGLYTFVPPVAGGASLPIANWQFVPSPNSVDEFAGLHSSDTLSFIADNATAAPLFSPLEGYAYPYRDDTYWGLGAELNFDLGFAELVIIPAYRKSELDNQFNGSPFKAAINQDEAKQASIEARLSGETDSLEWILGAYYFDENVKGVNSFNQFATVSHNSYDSNVESAAVFARGSFSVTDELRLVGGVRYTTEDRSIEAYSTSTAGVCLIEPAFGAPSCEQVPTIPVGLTLDDSLAPLIAAKLFPAAPPTVGMSVPYGPFGETSPQAILAITPTAIDEDDSDSKVTYRAAVEYDLTHDSLLYASFETGFRAGGFNVSFGNETYEPEEIDAFTIGSKNRFMGNRLELNLEAFLWQYENQQLAALGVDARGDNSFYTRNVGESTIQGLELDFQFLAAEKTLIRGGLQLLDTEYDNFSYNQVDLSEETDPPNFLTPITGCDVTQIINPDDAADRSFNIDCSGQETLYSPDVSANIGVEQTFYISTGSLIASIDVRHRSDRWVGFGYHPGAKTGDSTTIDASVTYESDFGYAVTLYGRNLTDEYIPATYQVGAGNVATSALEPPMTYGLRLNYEY